MTALSQTSPQEKILVSRWFAARRVPLYTQLWGTVCHRGAIGAPVPMTIALRELGCAIDYLRTHPEATVVALAGGQQLASFEGPQPPGHLRRWVDSLLAATAGKLAGGPDADGEAEAADPVLEDAREKLDAGDFLAAAAAYQAILDADPSPVGPHHAEAAGALRQITFLERATAHPPTAVADADAAPQGIDAAFAAADVQILNQDVAAAFQRLTALVRATAGDERTRVRTRLIELFDLFDPADPEVIAGRRNLANALY